MATRRHPPIPKPSESLTRPPNILEFFQDWLHFQPSPYQTVLLKTLFGIPLVGGEWVIYQRATGRHRYYRLGFTEATIISGARGGKSILAAGIILYHAFFSQFVLTPTEQPPWAVIVAQDRNAAKGVVLTYLKRLVRGNPILLSMVAGGEAGLQADRIILSNGWTLGAFSSTDASAQGFRIAVAVLDECAYYAHGATMQNTDEEIQAMCQRGQIGMPPGSKRLIKISTPRGKTGLLFNDYSRWFGKDDPNHLVWRADSISMNPADVKPEELDILKESDEVRYRRYYLAEFGDDEAAFLAFQDIERARVPGRTQDLPPRSSTVYAGGVDSSGGTGRDNFTFCICHREVTPDGNVFVVMDLLRVWNRQGDHFDLNAVCDEIVTLCRRYGIDTVYGDNYAGGLAQDQIRLRGIKYDLPHQTTKVLHGAAPVSWREGPTLHRSELYLKLLPFFTLGNIEIHDDPALLRELQMLERNAGTDKIDHPTGLRDDRCSALATAVCMLVLNDDHPTPGARAVQGSSLTQALGYPNPIVPARLVGPRRVMKVKKIIDVLVEGDLCECGHYHHRAPNGIACAVFCTWCREKRPPVPLGLRPTEKKEVEVEEREHDLVESAKIKFAGHPAAPAGKNKLPNPMGGFVRGSGFSRW